MESLSEFRVTLEDGIKICHDRIGWNQVFDSEREEGEVYVYAGSEGR